MPYEEASGCQGISRTLISSFLSWLKERKKLRRKIWYYLRTTKYVLDQYALTLRRRQRLYWSNPERMVAGTEEGLRVSDSLDVVGRSKFESLAWLFLNAGDILPNSTQQLHLIRSRIPSSTIRILSAPTTEKLDLTISLLAPLLASATLMPLFIASSMTCTAPSSTSSVPMPMQFSTPTTTLALMATLLAQF